MDFEPMSPEERERMMQFLLNQQAQFAADFSESQEDARVRSQQVDERMNRMSDAVVGLAGIVGSAVDVLGRFDQRLDRLAETQAATDARLKQLADAQTRTDEHLNVVITMFERHLGTDHGASPS